MFIYVMSLLRARRVSVVALGHDKRPLQRLLCAPTLAERARMDAFSSMSVPLDLM